MPRYAFRLRIRAGAIEQYDLEHTRVWPELLAKLKEAGISDYFIFRRGQDLFLTLCAENFERAWEVLDQDAVNQRWQALMSNLFEPIADLEPGERFAMMKQVFHLD